MVMAGDLNVSADGSDVFSGEKWVTPESVEALDAAISAAEDLLGLDGPTQVDVDDAIASLAKAKAGYSPVLGLLANEGEIDVFEHFVEAVEALLGEAKVSIGGSDIPASEVWASQADVDALKKAVGLAREALEKEGLTQAELSAVNEDLSAALAAYRDAQQLGKANASTDGDETGSSAGGDIIQNITVGQDSEANENGSSTPLDR